MDQILHTLVARLVYFIDVSSLCGVVVSLSLYTECVGADQSVYTTLQHMFGI